jgi:hypothetical protein
MKTSELAKEFRAMNSTMNMAEALALVEDFRNEEVETPAEYAGKYAKFLVAKAQVLIDLNHREFKTQLPLHADGCLVCGAMILVGA